MFAVSKQVVDSKWCGGWPLCRIGSPFIWRDAVMSAIEDALAYSAPHTHIVVFTDGEDNRSKTPCAALKAKIQEAKDKGTDFTFLGAEEAKLEEAAEA